jgi:hypothetical protein
MRWYSLASSALLAGLAASCSASQAARDSSGKSSSSSGKSGSSEASGSSSGGSDAATLARPSDAGIDDSVFLAFAKDFEGFRSWPHFDVTMDEDGGAPHPQPRLIEYINRVPPHGSTAFPLRTIIVKEANSAPASPPTAMVKRGGNFNPDGAVDWEWFDLVNIAGGGTSILWRGVGPPVNQGGYGGDPNGGCNDCHTPARNDCVLATALKLENF